MTLVVSAVISSLPHAGSHTVMALPSGQFFRLTIKIFLSSSTENSVAALSGCTIATTSPARAAEEEMERKTQRKAALAMFPKRIFLSGYIRTLFDLESERRLHRKFILLLIVFIGVTVFQLKRVIRRQFVPQPRRIPGLVLDAREKRIRVVQPQPVIPEIRLVFVNRVSELY